MKTIRNNQKRRQIRNLRIRLDRLSLPLVLMGIGYLLGCAIGSAVVINADVDWIRGFSEELVAKPDPGLFTVFCSFAAFSLGLLFLATSYLGFLLIPGVFCVRGFLSASAFTVCICSGIPHALEQACVRLFFPGLFLLPALLILGRRCMYWSVRMLRCRAGELLPPNTESSRPLALSFLLLMAAAVMKTYIVPYALDLF